MNESPLINNMIYLWLKLKFEKDKKRKEKRITV